MFGIVSGVHFPGYNWWAVILFFLLATVIVWCALRRQPSLVVPLLFCALSGYLSIQPWLVEDLPDHHVARFAEQGRWRVTGRVANRPLIKQKRLRFVLSARKLVQADRTLAVTGKIQITARGRIPNVLQGDTVTLSGHLHGVRNFCNPGGFDYERYMAFQGIRCRLYTRGERIRVTAAGHQGWRRHLDRLRTALAERLSTALKAHPSNVVQLLKALTLGDRSGISPELREAFSRAGVSHVLAISGLHVGMVATAAFFMFRWFLVRIPIVARHLLVFRGAAAICFFPVLFYGLLSGFSPSTQRAVIMVGVFLAGFWVGRLYNWPNVLAVAALTILVCSPPALTTISFQLSFAAVTAILLGIGRPPFARPNAGMTGGRRWAAKAAALFWVSLLATLGTLPLVMHYFNVVSWVGPFANLCVVPLVGTIVLPAALIGTVLAPLSFSAAAVVWQVAAWGMGAVLWIVHRLSTFDLAAVTTVTPTVVEMMLFYLLLGVLFFWKRVRFRGVILGLLLLAASGDALYWCHRRFDNDRMVVTAVDVGQGSANLLQLPGGYTVLIDGGGFSDTSSFDVGRSILAPLLWRKKIKCVDLVVLSHPNSDHLNGLLYILRNFRVGEIWSNHEDVDTMGYRQWQAIIAERKLTHLAFEQLPRRSQRAGVGFEILSPPADFKNRRVNASWRDANNNSLVMKIFWREVSFLFTGDIEQPAELELVAECGADELNSTFLMVPHHGSRSSSIPAFVQAVRPIEAIVSAGWHNRFHFPSREVIERYRSHGSRLWRTDCNGAIEITTDGYHYRIRSCRPACD